MSEIITVQAQLKKLYIPIPTTVILLLESIALKKDNSPQRDICRL